MPAHTKAHWATAMRGVASVIKAVQKIGPEHHGPELPKLCSYS